MPGLHFEPFSDAHLGGAARLLAERHRRHLDAEPLLAAKPDFRAEVEEAWSEEDASGSVVIEEGKLRGYLLAAPRSFANTGLKWHVVGFAGHALEGDPEVLRDLYADAARRWVDGGHTRQGVYVPASETGLIDAWFRLCFGASGVTAVRETIVEPFDSELSVRDGRPDDLEEAARLDGAMADSMQPAPSFSGMTATSWEDRVEEWRDTWDDEQFKHFVAELHGRLVGHLLLYTGRKGLRIPVDSIDLAAASTEPEARGVGAGRALTTHALTWAHDHGYRSMTIDWRMTNLLASRFWPKRGFRPTFLRMYRSIP
jgi:ribosomal protein S18 acetylase RimI-like enzyme